MEIENLQKIEEMKRLASHAQAYKLKLDNELKHMKLLHDENVALKLRYEAEQNNLQNESERIRSETLKKKMEWEHQLKLEIEEKQKRHLEYMEGLKIAQENEIKRIQEEGISKKKQQEKSVKSTFDDKNDSQLGLRYRKNSSPSNKISVTKSRVNRTVQKLVMNTGSEEKKHKSNVSSKDLPPKTNPVAIESYPVGHDDGQEFLWSGEKQETGIKNAAMNGLKFVKDTATALIPDYFTTETYKKGRAEGFQEVMYVDALEEDDDEFDEITLFDS